MRDVKTSTLRVLVADDHAVIRNMVRAILKEIGLEEVVHADNGSAAVEAIRDSNIDFIICDWNMPILSGIEVLKFVRSDERFKDLPFLMLTAEAYRENVEEAVNYGVTDYISKPFTAEVLLSKVTKILGSKLPR